MSTSSQLDTTILSACKTIFFHQYCSFRVENDSAEEVCYSEKELFTIQTVSVKGQVGEASREISFPQVRLISHWEF